MNKSTILAVLACLGAVGTAWAQATPASAKGYVIRFHEAAVPQVQRGSVRDDRVAQDPAAWGYVGERVLGHVQTLEKKHKFQAHAAFGTVFKGMAARLTPAQLANLQREPSVDLIEEEQVYSIGAQSIPWGISKTQATLSYTLAGNGSGAVTGVRAYIIDTGVDMSTRSVDFNRTGQVNFVGGKNTDCNGHGTHVAGTVAASDNTSLVVGVAPGVPVYGVKVLDCNGSGTTSSVIKGVDWVAANAVKPAVANMSLGGGVSQLLDDAVRRAAGTGIFFALAAGNSAVNACNSSPARVGGVNNTTGLGVMTVGATDSADKAATFSNYGACVDIWAPGVGVLSLYPGGRTATLSGTSMASPHVAGAAALHFGRSSGITAASVASTLKGVAVPTGALDTAGSPISRLNANVQ